jgi:hypothetical protein
MWITAILPKIVTSFSHKLCERITNRKRENQMSWEAILLSGLMFTALPEEDKKQHFVAGAAISGVSTEVFGLNPLQACGISLASGAAKEFYDHQTGGVVDAADVFATTAGCAITIRF